MHAAFKEYVAAGTGDVPVARICKTARVTTRQFYEVFTDRDALFAAVYERAAEVSLAAVVEAVAGRPDIGAAIRAMLNRLFKAEISTDLGEALYVLFTVGATSVRLRERRVESIRLAGERLAVLLGEVDAQWSDRLRCSILVAAVVQALEAAWLGSGLAEADEVVDAVMEIFAAA